MSQTQPQAQPSYLFPEDRALVSVEGEDARGFLQGLISNDVEKVTPSRAVYAALLTPQGKFLFDFFVVQLGEALLLDCEASRRDDLIRRLSMYRLRSKVTIEPVGDELIVALLYGDGAIGALRLPAEPGAAQNFGGGLAYVDPRLDTLGARAVLPASGATGAVEGQGFAAGDAAGYDALRIALGAPDGSRDLEVEKSLLLESGFDELNGIDWDKGCFVGQELTARTRYRGLVKKRLVPVAIDGPPPAPGTMVMQDDREAGIVRTVRDGAALALLRLDAIERAAGDGAPLTAGEARLIPRKREQVVR